MESGALRFCIGGFVQRGEAPAIELNINRRFWVAVFSAEEISTAQESGGLRERERTK
jgi:hypothetical protein